MTNSGLPHLAAHDAASIREASFVRPSERQVAWQRMEFYAFIHFGMNTMTDREWGLGHESPELFDPTALDAGQWVDAIASAGMTGVILTCKHHDGFALWPTKVSSHSVASSPWRGGEGDVVAEVARACAERGLRFGVYLSPWDRTEQSYGSGPAYDDFFVAQLTELLTGYGEIFTVWLDGANGEGPDGRRQYYDWDRYYEVVRSLQPNAVISVCGPDVRWCGNEAGHTRPDEWSVVPASLREAEGIASRSQQADDGEFARRVLSDDADLGSRDALLASTEPLVWYPAEVNTSIRPGWFHHPAEDSAVRSVDELFEIYLSSVGGNATFLLNVPPARDGLLADEDLDTLAALGDRIRAFDASDIAGSAAVTVSSGEVADRGWRPAPTGLPETLSLTWDAARTIDAVALREDILIGQQIESVSVRGTSPDGESLELGRARSVGYQRIIRFPAVEVIALEIELDAYRGPFALTQVRAFAASSPVGSVDLSTGSRNGTDAKA
ncbi:alpha-L-fucosidase [Humibacter soli]